MAKTSGGGEEGDEEDGGDLVNPKGSQVGNDLEVFFISDVWPRRVAMSIKGGERGQGQCNRGRLVEIDNDDNEEGLDDTL